MSGRPSGESFSAEVSLQVIELLNRFRRTVEPAEGNPGGTCEASCEACFEALHPRLDYYTRRSEPIHFVLPAFPAKSPNRKKVLGELPDLGERIALSFLQSLCDYVGHFYNPGARVTICSDGHVFGDVVGVTDTAVTDYRTSLEDMIRGANWTSLDMFGLDDAFGGMNYPKLRQILESDYAQPLDVLKKRVQTEDGARSMFNGIHRFMFEDALGTRRGEVSKTKIRNESKESAYQTIRRSNAWSKVVAERFPTAVRLSIHPQPPHTEKIGLQLMRTKDTWLTPWHGVVLDNGITMSLVKVSIHGSPPR